MHRRNATLVVIEFGASWPRWLAPGDLAHTAVVAQHYEGPPDSLVTQVKSRIARLLHAGWRVHDVVLVSNGKSDAESLTSRSVLAHELVALLQATNGFHLLLSVEPSFGRRACTALTELARSLRVSAVTVGTRFGDDDPVYSRVTRAS